MIIVKDMEMPDTCIDCEFHSWSFKRQGIYCRRTGNFLINYQSTRDADCPLEEYNGEKEK